MRIKAILFSLLCGCFLITAPVFADMFDIKIDYKRIDFDVASHYPTEDFLVIKNKADLERVVKACADESVIGRDIELPKIDFEKNMLIAVFGGRNTASSYSMYIENIFLEDNKVIVNVVKQGPQQPINYPNLTSPYYMVLMPKTDLGVKFFIKGVPSEYSTADCLRLH